MTFTSVVFLALVEFSMYCRAFSSMISGVVGFRKEALSAVGMALPLDFMRLCCLGFWGL